MRGLGEGKWSQGDARGGLGILKMSNLFVVRWRLQTPHGHKISPKRNDLFLGQGPWIPGDQMTFFFFFAELRC